PGFGVEALQTRRDIRSSATRFAEGIDDLDLRCPSVEPPVSGSPNLDVVSLRVGRERCKLRKVAGRNSREARPDRSFGHVIGAFRNLSPARSRSQRTSNECEHRLPEILSHRRDVEASSMPGGTWIDRVRKARAVQSAYEPVAHPRDAHVMLYT